MHLSVRGLLRVLWPLVGLPHGVHGWRPPEDLPSPPPIGWSIGFIATPRTFGRLPSQRERPALPMHVLVLEVADLPIVAMQRTWTQAVLAAGHAQRGVVALARHELRADAGRAHELRALARLQLDRVDTVPSGMFASGSALPGRISASWPAASSSPTASPSGARM